MKKCSLAALLLCASALIIISCSEDPDLQDPFVKAEMKWRKDRDERMKQSDSWLTIAGLFWLAEGVNKIGSDSDNDIILPAHSAPPFLGTLTLTNGIVEIKTPKELGLRIAGELVSVKKLQTDMDEHADVMVLGKLKFWIIRRGKGYALRIRDLTAKRFKEYHGIEYYPVNKEYSVRAKLLPYSEPRLEIVNTIVGTEEEYTIPGYLEFELKGQKLRLDPFVVKSDSSVFFLIIKDATSGAGTYGAGRFMYAKILPDSSVGLNFNRAYNPPCAFTPYATCPLPPPQNILDIAIEAGEKKYGGNH